MNCEDARKYLNEYIDGFLSDAQCKQIAAHLALCDTCRKEAEALLKLRGEIRALKLENTDDFVFDLARAKSAALPVRHKWLPAVSAVAACFVLFIGVYAAVQNGYHTPAVQQEFSADNADAASEVAFAGETEQVNKTVEQSRHTKTMTVSEDDAYRTVPEGVTPFSSVILDVEATEESQNAKVEFFGEVDSKEHAINAPVLEDASAPVAPERAEDVRTEQKSSGASAGGASLSGAAGGSVSGATSVVPAPAYTKRTVTLFVDAGAQNAFANSLSGMLCAGFDGETVIAEGDLRLLLAIEGVTVVSDETVAADVNRYSGKIVIFY